ncbi:Golgi complex component 7-domain-containing protein [Irpex lacteus]|nr:Golgi complex component 7-domain-containing protein [Irpex lacteus]
MTTSMIDLLFHPALGYLIGSAVALSDLDKRVTNLVGTLELASEDTSLQVERIIDDISRGASRLTYDLHFMRDGALSLQSLLQNVETKAKSSLAPDTNAALERLHFLDTVKRNMEAAREVLREAESWSTLESDVISLLGEQNYERAAERLSEANKSMVVFQNTPEYESRRTLMFRNYYYGSRKAPLVELTAMEWSEGEPGVQTFAQFLPTFYAAFLTMLSTERTPPVHAHTSTLSSLQPTFSERLTAVASYHGAKALPQLLQHIRHPRIRRIRRQDTRKNRVSTQLSITGGDTDGNEKKLRRRSSTRMSISRRMGPHRASISGNPLTAPGLPTWDQELVEPSSTTKPTTVHSKNGSLLRERSVDVFGVADEAITRCQAFTHGYGAASLVQALENFFKSFVDQSKAEVASSKTGAAGGLAASASGELADLDYTSEDWATIQALLHTLEAGRLRTTLVAISHTLRLSRADPIGGIVQVLVQSTLNNVELHDLLEPVLNTYSPSRCPRTPTAFTFPLNTTTTTTTSPGPLLPSSHTSISSFAAHCQLALQDVILSPLRTRLATYPSLPLWSAKSKRLLLGNSGKRNLSSVDTDVLPLPDRDDAETYRGVLNLPRLFEVYADDDALSFSLETLPFVRGEMLRALADPSPGDVSPVSGSGPSHSRRAGSLSMKTPPVLPPPTQPPLHSTLPPEAVSAAWLSSLGLSLLSHLTTTVLPSIKTLSAEGAAQLASDLGYLGSVVMVLNVEDEGLERWKEWVGVEDGVGRERYREEFANGGSGERDGCWVLWGS